MTTDRIIGRREELQALVRFVDAIPTGGHASLSLGAKDVSGELRVPWDRIARHRRWGT